MANKQIYTNNATSSLTATITAVATSIAITAGTGALFPNPSAGDFFYFTLYDGTNIEVCKCTARTVDTFTVVVRGQDGTTPFAFTAGSSVQENVTKGTLEQFLQRTGDTPPTGFAASGANTDITSMSALTTVSTAGSVSFTRANAGGSNNTFFINSDNTNAASHTVVRARTGGASSGDPTFSSSVDGVTTYTWGIDNSDSDKFKLSASSTLGTTDIYTLDSTGVSTFLFPTIITGTTTNDSAAVGQVGEYVSSTVVAGSAVALTSAVAADVTSISLTAGDWDVSAMLAFVTAATTSYTSMFGGASSTSATVPGLPDRVQFSTAATVPGVANFVKAQAPTRFSLASTTTIYLVAQAGFTVSTLSAYGRISARRIR